MQKFGSIVKRFTYGGKISQEDALKKAVDKKTFMGNRYSY